MSLGFLDSCTFLLIFMNSVLSLNSFLKGLMLCSFWSLLESKSRIKPETWVLKNKVISSSLQKQGLPNQRVMLCILSSRSLGLLFFIISVSVTFLSFDSQIKQISRPWLFHLLFPFPLVEFWFPLRSQFHAFPSWHQVTRLYRFTVMSRMQFIHTYLQCSISPPLQSLSS